MMPPSGTSPSLNKSDEKESVPHQMINSSSGRPRRIPPETFETFLQLYAAGHGYRSIVNELRGLGIGATYSSVRRLIKDEGAARRAMVVGR